MVGGPAGVHRRRTAPRCSIRRPGASSAGRRPTPAAIEEVARAAAARLEPGDDLHATAAYRRRVAATLARRTLTTAAARATDTGS